MYKLTNTFFLISGSISTSTEDSKIKIGLDFVSLLARAIVKSEGGLVVYLASEPVSESGLPLIFDWLVVREVEALFKLDSIIKCLKIVTSQYAIKEKMSSEQRKLIYMLVANDVAEIHYIQDDTITGGNIGDEQVKLSDAMIALGGGKGVLDRANKLAKRQCPILPLDLELGALSEDSKGSVKLVRKFIEQPSNFFPYTGDTVVSKLPAMSLEEPATDLEAIANRVVEAFVSEKEAKLLSVTPDVLILTAIPIELTAAKEAFGISEDESKHPTSHGIHTWKAVVTRNVGSSLNCRIANFGQAGNNSAAAITSMLIGELKPKHVVMFGIAAGMRGKCKLGEVLVADRVVAYQGAAALAGGKLEPRPEITRMHSRVQQDLSAYLSDTRVESRLIQGMSKISLKLPDESKAGEVTKSIAPKLATLASGEWLLRDPDKFSDFREIHGKVEVAEMEAAGISDACHQHNVPMTIIRGISDFGDSLKDNSFHQISAKAAALVTYDYVKFGITDHRTSDSIS